MSVIDETNYKVKSMVTNRTVMVNKCRLKKCFERKILEELNIGNTNNNETSQEATTANVVRKERKKSKISRKNSHTTVTNSKEPIANAKTNEHQQANSTRYPKRIRKQPDRLGLSNEG